MDWTDRIGSRLKLRDLHILLAVIEWGSMAKAARHLAVSQPVISRAIADLERELGVRLLERSPHGIESTVYGRTLLNRGLAVFDELRGSVKDIRFLRDPMAGELRIGSNQAIAGGFLAAVLDKLSAQRPRLTFQIKLGDAATLYHHDLRERHVDLLFGRVIELEEDDANAEILFNDRLYVVAGVNSPWVRRRKLTLKNLVNEPWTMPPSDSYAGSLIADAFHASHVPMPQIAVAGAGIQMQSALLGTGRFLSVLPGSFLRFNGKRLGLKALPIALRIPPRPVGVITLKNRTLSPLAAIFIECAREVARELGPHGGSKSQTATL
jgi:DNA-binding transcriptional LysR family regulator